jgi:hypothetical protein
MGLALETVLGFAELGSTGAFLPLTPGTDQSFSIRNFTAGGAVLEDLWGVDSAHAATISVKSPKLHDDVYGIFQSFNPLDAGGNATFNPQSLLTGAPTQTVYATDTLSVTAEGTADDLVAAIMNIYYSNLSGINARLYNWAQIQPLIVNEAGVQVTAETSATANQWGTSVALNSGLYRWKANTDYAILGATVGPSCTAVSVSGTDTGNLRLGLPGYWNTKDGSDFFIRKSNQYGTPHIPVINANNAPNTNVAVSGIATASDVLVTFRVAQLSQLLPDAPVG